MLSRLSCCRLKREAMQVHEVGHRCVASCEYEGDWKAATPAPREYHTLAPFEHGSVEPRERSPGVFMRVHAGVVEADLERCWIELRESGLDRGKVTAGFNDQVLRIGTYRLVQSSKSSTTLTSVWWT